MKPKTKIQQRVFALHQKLKPISEKRIQKGFKHSTDNWLAIQRKRAYCLECGHSWRITGTLQASLTGVECPECGKNLKWDQDYRGSAIDSAYYGIYTTRSEFQVIRLFVLEKHMKKNRPADYSNHEVMQHWIREDGAVCSMAKPTSSYGFQYDKWIYHKDMEVKPTQFRHANVYKLIPYKIEPGRRVLPVIKRNGYQPNYVQVCDQDVMRLILTDPYAETLIKADQPDLFKHYIKYDHYQSKIRRHWGTIKICIRNNYIVKDTSTYLDQIKYLERFGKDLHNPHYVCPENLEKEHQKYIKKQRKIDLQEKIEENRKKIEEQQRRYMAMKNRFLGLQFKNGGLTVKVFDHVKDIFDESNAFFHCAFSNEYHMDEESLMMSARLNGKPIETVQFSLDEMRVEQARGMQNAPSEYHDQIINLVESNVNQIKNRLNA